MKVETNLAKAKQHICKYVNQDQTCHGDTAHLLHSNRGCHRFHTHQLLALDGSDDGSIAVCCGSVSAV